MSNVQYLCNVSAENAKVIEQLLNDEDSRYLSLRSFLLKHGKGTKLLHFLRHMENFDTSKQGNIVGEDKAGFVWAKAPVRELAAKYGGGMQTWHTAINAFCVLELLYVHKPGNHAAENNTEAQNHSIEVARKHGGNSRPASYYSIPQYTPERLAEAERLASALKDVPSSRWKKDLLRDRLGTKAANMATDTAYGLHPETAEQREELKAALLRLIQEKGYAYPEEPLREALTQSEELKEACRFELFDEMEEAKAAKARAQRAEYWYTETWKGYMPTLLREEQLKKSTPTKQDMELFNLSSKRHIIRSVKE